MFCLGEDDDSLKGACWKPGTYDVPHAYYWLGSRKAENGFLDVGQCRLVLVCLPGWLVLLLGIGGCVVKE